MNAISPNITKPIAIVATPLITPEKAGKWLNLSAGMIVLNKTILEDLIKTVTEVVSDYSWLNLRRTTYEAFYDLSSSLFLSFLGGTTKLSLERSPIIALADITKIEYLDTDGTWTEFVKGSMTIAGLYENVTEKIEQRDWASVYFREGVDFDDTRYNAYKIKITFISGYTIATDITTDLPARLETAMLKIIAACYTNRGDCSDCGCDLNGFAVPCDAKSMIDQLSIANTIVGGAYNPTTECNTGWF